MPHSPSCAPLSVSSPSSLCPFAYSCSKTSVEEKPVQKRDKMRSRCEKITNTVIMSSTQLALTGNNNTMKHN